MALPAVDVFAGIGGMTYALRGAVRTVAYCEIDPKCQAVLAANTKRRLLPAAPVVSDVRDVVNSKFAVRPVVLLGGFPCQDVSSAVFRKSVGVQAGLRSSLVRYLFAFVDRHPSVRVVFLENVANIVGNGMVYVVHSLERRGFKVRWGVFSAEEVGGAHQRRRWFCLAVKGPVNMRRVPVTRMQPMDSVARLVPKTRELARDHKIRSQMLGNSVVPQCVAHAWNTLIKAPHNPSQPAHVPPPSLLTTCVFTYKNLCKRRWGTPTRSDWGQHRNFQGQAIQCLHNQLYYDDKTQTFLKKRHGWRGPAKLTDRHFCGNPAWVELLMGYPAGFTSGWAA